MDIFFSKVSVLPAAGNSLNGNVHSVVAHVFVAAETAIAAVSRTLALLHDQFWLPEHDEIPAALVTEAQFTNKAEGLRCYREATEKGWSIFLVGVRSDDASDNIPIGKAIRLGATPGRFQVRQKELRRRGRCLHFDAGKECTRIVEAHSIQKSGGLARIASDGKVYIPSADTRDLERSRGRLTLQLRGVSKVSTFRGMCDRHDNEIFRPIDDGPFIGDPNQAGLLAYRSLCRELFVKRNAVTQYLETLEDVQYSKARREQLGLLLEGARRGLSGLEREKSRFDDSLRSECSSNFCFRWYEARRRIPFAVSGILYPLLDFEGTQIQDLTTDDVLDTITFSTARSDDADALVFSWHRMSAASCEKLFASFDRRVLAGDSEDDLIARFVINNAENLAWSPLWVDQLADQQRDEIEELINSQVDLTKDFSPTALQEGLEGLLDVAFTRRQ